MDPGSRDLARLFVIFGSFIVLALITALVAPYFIDWDAYRADFEKEATQILGQQVTVAGKAKARLLPFPSVTFEDVRVGDPEKPLVVADRFSMDAELAPFLSGELLIFDMRLVNPTVDLRIDEQGLPDWTMPAAGSDGGVNVVLQNAHITNGAIMLHDEVDGRDWTMDGIDAMVSADSLLGPWRIDGSGWMDATPIAFKVSTGQLSRDGFSLRNVLELEKQGVEISVDGRMAKPEDSAGAPYNGIFTVRPLSGMSDRRYSVTGDFAASLRAVAVPEYRGEFGPAADPYVVSGSAGITGGAEPAYHIEVTGTQVTLPEAEGAAGETASPMPKMAAMPLSQRLDALQSTLAALPFPPIPGRLDIDLPAIVVGDTAIREIRLKASPDTSEDADPRRQWTISDFEAQLPGRTTVEAQGMLRLPRASDGDPEARFAGSLVVASRQPSGLAVWLTGAADDSVRRLSNAGIAADVLFSPEKQTVDNLELVLGPARLRGKLERTFDPSRRATLDIGLTGDKLDVDALEALSAIFIGKDGAARFADHDLDVSLDLTDPDIRGVKLDSLDALIRSRDARTEIDRLSVTGLYGASVSATGSLDQSNDTLIADLDATVVSDEGGRLFTGLAERFPDIEGFARFSAIARNDPRAFDETRLDIVGSIARKNALSGEASLSVSGASGGTSLTLTGTATGDMRDPEKAAVTINVTLDNPAAERLFTQAGLPTLAVPSPGPGSVEATIGGSLFDGMKSTVTLTSDDMDAMIDGVLTADILSTGFTGNMQIETSDIEPWLLTLGYAFPGTGLGTPADIQAAVSQRGGRFVLHDLNAVLDGNKITGDLTVESPETTPQIRGDLAFDFLDAGPFYAIVTGDPAAAVRAADIDTAMEREFGPPILAGHDVELGIQAGELTFPASDGKLNDLKATLVYRDGMMALNDVTARIGTGSIGGLVSLRNDGGQVLANAQISTEGLTIAELVPAIGPVLEGNADLTLQLTGTGRSNAALVDSLTGSGALSAGELTAYGVRGDGFAELVKEADAVGYGMTEEQMQTAAAAALFGGETLLPAKDYAISVTRGTMRLTNATAESGDLSIDLDGQLDVASGAISGNVRLSVDPGAEAAPGPQPEVTLAFQTSDGLFEIKRDYGPVTGYLTQRLLEGEQERVEALQARLLEKQRLRREVLLLQYYRRLDQPPPEPETPAEGEAIPSEDAERDEALLQPFAPGETIPRADPAVMRLEAAEEAARRFDARLGGSRPPVIELRSTN